MRAPIVPEMSVKELDSALKGDNPPFVLDVRETEEREIAHLSDHLHIPLMELNDRVSECKKAIGSHQDLVVYCRSGARSAFAVELLRESGLEQAKNLSGGINAWSHEINSSLPRY